MKFRNLFKRRKPPQVEKLELTTTGLPWSNFYYIAISIKLGSYFYSNILIEDIYYMIQYEPFNSTWEMIERLLSIFRKRDIWIRIQPIVSSTPINLFESYSDKILINNRFYYIKDVEYFLRLRDESFILLTS